MIVEFKKLDDDLIKQKSNSLANNQTIIESINKQKIETMNKELNKIKN